MIQMDKSIAAYEEAVTLMPGGVNSPVRAFQSIGMSPIFMKKGNGPIITDIDGNEYIDYVLSWGPLILGHTPDVVIDYLKEVMEDGTSFGAPTLLENKLAKLVMERVPSIERIRMVNSGTEATMSALRLARGYTGRSIILKFAGNYHGHGDSLLIKAGSGVATLGLPDSPGVPEEIAKQTITVPFNDKESVEQAFEKYGEQIAAVIVEPVAGNMGVVPPRDHFLSFLRNITIDYGSLLIFDEVMTGFRVAYQCAQHHYGVTPDLTCLGKIIGGGLPVGAYGGKREIMEMVAPAGPIYQAGTLSGNPLAMAAGYATLASLTKKAYDDLNKKIDILIQHYEAAAKQNNIPLQINRAGSMFSIFFTENEVVDFKTASQIDHERFKIYYRNMLKAGIYLPPSPYEGLFLSTSHSDTEIEQTTEAIHAVFQSLQA